MFLLVVLPTIALAFDTIRSCNELAPGVAEFLRGGMSREEENKMLGDAMDGKVRVCSPGGDRDS